MRAPDPHLSSRSFQHTLPSLLHLSSPDFVNPRHVEATAHAVIRLWQTNNNHVVKCLTDRFKTAGLFFFVYFSFSDCEVVSDQNRLRRMHARPNSDSSLYPRLTRRRSGCILTFQASNKFIFHTEQPQRMNQGTREEKQLLSSLGIRKRLESTLSAR